MRLTPPQEVLDIAATLRQAGFEAWCVGGAVRDALLGHAHLDWDIATSATPQHVQALFRRTIPVGVEFGTVGVLDRNKVMHEVTTFRKDVKTDGRHAVVEFGVSLDDDLARRDFTINAIAYNPETQELRDPFDGQTDLKCGVVRAVGTAADRMREDRLRALRAIRFASRLSFTIEAATWAAIRESAPHMGRLSAERVHQELTKTMEQVDHVSTAMEWWRESGALQALIPSLHSAPPSRFSAIDRLPRPSRGGEASAGVGADAQASAGTDAKGLVRNRLAMLWFGAAPSETERALKDLKCSKEESSWIVGLVRARHVIGEADVDSASDAQIRRWAALIGRTRVDAYFLLAGASETFRAKARTIAIDGPIEIADLAVDGEDLQKAGLSGPALGKALKSLLEIVIENPALNTNAELLKRVRA